MMRVPDLRISGRQLESLSAGQLFDLFEYFHKTKTTAIPLTNLAEAWGLLFSILYLSAEELVIGLQSGEHLLGKDKEHILREFIRDDCRSGGVFVLEVIQKGGNIDRAALIMIAGLEDLASLDYRGTTALHLLAEACDKRVRPALIGLAGKKALAEFYDAKGFPVLFTILTLNDLRGDDLNAIGQVFTREELRGMKKKNQTGRSMLEIYTEASQRLKGRVPGERNAFAVNHAVKNTNLRSALKSKQRPGSGGQRPGSDVMGEDGNDEAEAGNPNGRVQYRNILSNPLDDFAKIRQRKTGRK
jgi:hypothetical protein